eukprot:XP_001704435.1 Hypothetical protein GL50803_31526 [Giardia lamblia ATCC 50803]
MMPDICEGQTTLYYIICKNRQGTPYSSSQTLCNLYPSLGKKHLGGKIQLCSIIWLIHSLFLRCCSYIDLWYL